MKDLLCVFASLCLLANLAACGGGAAGSAPGGASSSAASSAPGDAGPAASDADPAPEAGSGSEPAPEATPAPDAGLAALVDAMYGIYDVELVARETSAIDLADPNMASYQLGLAEDALGRVDAAVISQSMTGSQAYSLVLARAKDPADAQALAADLFANAPTAKWICVQPDAVRMAVYGDVVLCLMTANDLADADAVADAFVEAVGGCDARDGRECGDGEGFGLDGAVMPVPDGAPVA